ncbi:MAG: sensor domain-containing diguanylate cyclase [Candidatus Latescibacterota bacterium]
MERDNPVILIVDNEIEICNLFRDFFDFMGYQSLIETNGDKAINEMESYSYDLLFVDLKLGSVSGVDILKRSKEIHPDAEVIVVTGFGSEETVLRTLLHGAFSYIQKPISFSEIRIQTDQALARRRFTLKTKELRAIVGNEKPALAKHLDDILSLDRFSTFINLTIDIETLADSILSGVAGIIPGCYYSFLFFDDVNREMVIFSNELVKRDVAFVIESQMREYFEGLVNRELGDRYVVRLSLPVTLSDEEDVPADDVSSYFFPVLVDNAVKGVLGISTRNGEVDAEKQDLLRLVSARVNKVLANATLHRDTKMLALTDGLTGLLNHRAFHERIRHEFERYRRYGSFLSLIVADFDDLKVINDTYGHPVGDEVLRELGDILRDASRESDVLARYGGDEFVILLPQTNARNAIKMAERIREKVEKHGFSIHNLNLQSTISIGVATVPEEGIDSPQDLLERADRALYEAKRSGKNRTAVAGSPLLH